LAAPTSAQGKKGRGAKGRTNSTKKRETSENPRTHRPDVKIDLMLAGKKPRCNMVKKQRRGRSRQRVAGPRNQTKPDKKEKVLSG